MAERQHHNNSSINGIGRLIYGNNNQIRGEGHAIYGNKNIIRGVGHRIYGNNNEIRGTDHRGTGNNNIISGVNIEIVGNNNILIDTPNPSNVYGVQIGAVYHHGGGRHSAHRPTVINLIDEEEAAAVRLPDAEPDEQPGAEGAELCSVCMERAISTVIVDCGHRSLCVTCCRDCALKGNGQCPQCRKKITHAIKTF
jgi:hypothetical protein